MTKTTLTKALIACVVCLVMIVQAIPVITFAAQVETLRVRMRDDDPSALRTVTREQFNREFANFVFGFTYGLDAVADTYEWRVAGATADEIFSIFVGNDIVVDHMSTRNGISSAMIRHLAGTINPPNATTTPPTTGAINASPILPTPAPTVTPAPSPAPPTTVIEQDNATIAAMTVKEREEWARNATTEQRFEWALSAEYTNAVRDEFYRLVNEHRVAHGVPELEVCPALQAHADIRAAELAISFSHTRPDGSRSGSGSGAVLENIAGTGQYLSRDGERLVDPTTRAYGVFSLWRNSTGHNRNLLRHEPTSPLLMAFGLNPIVDERGNVISTGAVFVLGRCRTFDEERGEYVHLFNTCVC